MGAAFQTESPQIPSATQTYSRYWSPTSPAPKAHPLATGIPRDPQFSPRSDPRLDGDCLLLREGGFGEPQNAPMWLNHPPQIRVQPPQLPRLILHVLASLGDPITLPTKSDLRLHGGCFPLEEGFEEPQNAPGAAQPSTPDPAPTSPAPKADPPAPRTRPGDAHLKAGCGKGWWVR